MRGAKSLLYTIFVGVSLYSVTCIRAESLADIAKSGKFSADLKLFYLSKIFDRDKKDATAFTAGGIIKYESAISKYLKFAIAYCGSHRIGGFYSAKDGADTNLLQKKEMI